MSISCDLSYNWSTYTGPPWSRATLVCNNSNYSQFELDMRRKAQILQYKRKQNNPTKKQLWSMLNKGELTRKKTWATQGINISNPNTNNLTLVGNTLVCNSNTVEPLIIVNSSTSSDVPGKPIGLYLNQSVPLTNYRRQITYSAGGSKYPETAWMPGDNGFPVGKSGSNLLINKNPNNISAFTVNGDNIDIIGNDAFYDIYYFATPNNIIIKLPAVYSNNSSMLNRTVYIHHPNTQIINITAYDYNGFTGNSVSLNGLTWQSPGMFYSIQTNIIKIIGSSEIGYYNIQYLTSGSNP